MPVVRSSFLAAALLFAAPVQGAESPVEKRVGAMAASPSVKRLLDHLKSQDDASLREQRELAEIPAPPFKEEARARAFQSRLQLIGLDARIDAEGNVIARRPGIRSASAPTLVLSAHLDTVFPEGTDVTVKERDGRLFGPGLADDARGLAVVLAIARALQESNIATLGDILFVGTVGEEGEGNLRGVKALVRDNPAIDGFISIDGIELSKIVSRGTGSRRWRIEFSGEGGHSFLDFGRPSAVHAMGRVIAAIGDLVPPATPRTTFTVGVAKGGTSVNAIAGKATIEIDLRSDGGSELLALEKQVMAAVDTGIAAENRRWNSQKITASRTLIGDRPGGATPDTSRIVQVSLAAAQIGGVVPKLANSSTDSNVPIALGIPAITLPGGGEGGDFHSLGEWYRPVTPWIGTQRAALTVLSLVGVEGAGEPLLEKRAVNRSAP